MVFARGNVLYYDFFACQGRLRQYNLVLRAGATLRRPDAAERYPPCALPPRFHGSRGGQFRAVHVVQPRSLHPKVLTATFFFLYEYLSYTHVTLFTAFSYIIFDTDNRLGPTRPPLHTRDGRGKERNRNRNIWSEKKHILYLCGAFGYGGVLHP